MEQLIHDELVSRLERRVERERATRLETERIAESLRQNLTRNIRRDLPEFEGVRVEVTREDPGRFRLYDIPTERVSEAEDFIKDELRGWSVSRGRDAVVGVHLHDVLGISDHHVPGKGNINWEMVTKYLPPKILKVCEIGEWNTEEQILGVVEFLHNRRVLN